MVTWGLAFVSLAGLLAIYRNWVLAIPVFIIGLVMFLVGNKQYKENNQHNGNHTNS
jgi:hypothetical protein